MRSTRHVLSGARRETNTFALHPASVLLLVISIALCAHAQTLALDPHLKPPALSPPTWAANQMQELERQVAELQARLEGRDNAAQQALLASIRCRTLAANLLAAGDRAGAEGSVMILSAMHLVAGLAEIDESLSKLLDTPENTSKMASLRAFNRAALTRSQRGWSIELAALDEELRSTFTPLADCIGAVEGSAVVSHWPAISSGSTDGSHANTLLELRERIASATLSPQARDDLLFVCDCLARGQQFAELAPRILLYTAVVNSVLDHANVIAEAAWLSAPQRSTLEQELTEAVTMFKEAGTREQGVEQIGSWSNVDLVIGRLTVLSRHNVDTKKLAATIFKVDAPSLPRDKLVLVAGVLERMIEYRTLESTGVAREWRLIERDLHEAYRAAEAALLKRLMKSSDSSWSLSDPEFASLITEQKHLLADLAQVRRLPQWMKSMLAIDSNAAKRFEDQALKLAKGLTDPNARPDSIKALGNFDSQLRRFEELSMELSLRSSTAAAIELTGGLHVELLGTIGEARRAWAREWADTGTAIQSTPRMENLARLTQAMSEVTTIIRSESKELLLNRWAGWQCEDSLLEQSIRELVNRLKLATASAIANEDEALAQQLERIDRDAPLVRLAGRLTQLLSDDLTNRPDGALGTLGKLTNPPGTSALMANKREMLAHLCRYAAEERQARQANQIESANAIRDYINSQAGRLLREIESYDEPVWPAIR